jgi:hypothetical protein
MQEYLVCEEGFVNTIGKRVRKDLGDLLNCFFGHTQHISRHSNFDCEIKLEDHNGWKGYWPRKLSKKDKNAVKEFVKDRLRKNYIALIISPYVNNILLVKKPDGSFITCVDYRELNKRTKDDIHSFPEVNGFISKMNTFAWYSKIGLKSAYYN